MNMNYKIRTIFLSLGLMFSLPACASDSATTDIDDSPASQKDYQAVNDEQSQAIEGKTSSDNNLFLVEVVWQNQSLNAGTLENTAVVHITNSSGESIQANLKSFKLFMVSMGHGSIKEDEMVLSQLSNGSWRVDNIYFSMGGPANSWAVDIEAESDGQTDNARVLITQEVN